MTDFSGNLQSNTRITFMPSHTGTHTFLTQIAYQLPHENAVVKITGSVFAVSTSDVLLSAIKSPMLLFSYK